MSAFADLASRPGRDVAVALRGGLFGELIHSGLGLVVSLVVEVLNVYKPRGAIHRRRRGRVRTVGER